ncbi:MAG TPA: tripartite tricarboxylate transporter substrate binding protein [Burkholderiales bacterium]|nr:tripartite tricarboxylate transporter substrate binding protein [Burkholderiales bacterium]
MKKILCLLAATLFASAACAQDYPRGTVRLVVPFPPGGPTDIVGRLMAQKLGEVWNASVIVENRPGAGTSIGTDAVAKSAPDGQTIGMVITAYMINPSLQAKLPFDTLKDLANVTQLVTQHVVLVANPKEPFNTVAELVAYARKNPGKLTYASPGSGTSAHLAGELLKNEAGIDMVHVPYKGSGPAQVDLVAGRVDLMMDVYHSAKPQVDAGKLKVIALAAPTRPPGLAQYPVIAETVPNVSVTSLFGLVVPAATPRPIVNRIYADSLKVLAMPDVRERLTGLGLEVVGSSPEQFDAFVRSEIAKWAKVIKDNDIKAD